MPTTETSDETQPTKVKAHLTVAAQHTQESKKEKPQKNGAQEKTNGKEKKRKKTSISLFTLTRSLDLLCFSNFTSLCLIKHLINLLCVGGEAIGRER